MGSLHLAFIGTAKWVGANLASLIGLSRDALAGKKATTELICNTQRPKSLAKALNRSICPAPVLENIAGA